MAIKRIYFDEYTDGCLYHPKPGCVHRANDGTGKFISSLTEARTYIHAQDMHAPALDIDFPTTVETLDDGWKTRIEIKGPRPTNANFRRLLEVLVSTRLMDADEAQRLRGRAAGGRRRNLPAFALRVEARTNSSSTPGHFHLYIEHEMSWHAYEQLLLALRDAEIIGKDFCDMCTRWRVSFLLKPGVTKSDLKLRFETPT